MRRALEADLGKRGLSLAMVETHPHLFASVPMFVSRDHLEIMARVVKAVEAVAATPLFRQAALAWAPKTARHDPGSPGGLLGFDFHLGATGPQVIEINTNPGGALLNTVLGRAHRSCCADAAGLAMAPLDPDAVEEALFEVFMTEWRLRHKEAPLRTVAIVDEAPQQQYLYPEFLLYQQLFSRHGIEALICDPGDLLWKDGQLWNENKVIDFVYNRLTDFALTQPAHAALGRAYQADGAVVSPHPRAHAVYADKRNLILLCKESFLRETGVAEDVMATLLGAIPRTEVMTKENREALWANRRQLFFKPAAGYGSKAAYRGDKLTRRVWEEMAGSTYVAQALVTPSERTIAGAPAATALKADVRAYAYAGAVKLVTARLYQGQTTNFRTPGGGFAPVFSQARSAT
ncbi:hypothetical protein [Polaromonas sp. SM01]|uniref:hypothetical protein n=1 Tax=Polaromonas sp. SM01 TaxID=3085630 RepID=UPI00298137C3|nr:hypothetical protein [Polaromonas sp. SM01]MDW5443505.1 hypothetical protein [Polaromonas sp. SM01]